MSTTNSFQMRINSLQQQFNSKWKQFSNVYSKFLIRFPWSILAVSSFITIGLTIYFLLFMEIRSFDQNDFLLSNSPARKNAFHLKEIFGNDVELRIHQQLNLYPALDLIIKRKLNTNQTNMLVDEIVDEMRLLDKQIQSIKINNSDNSIEYNYSSLCIVKDHACMIDGNYLLGDQFREHISNLILKDTGYFVDGVGANGLAAFMFGKDYHLINATPPESDYVDPENEEPDNDSNNIKHTDLDNEESDNDSSDIKHTGVNKVITYAPLFRLRYSLNTTTEEMKQLAIQWERQALRYLNNEYQSLLIDLFPSTSTAISDTISKKSHEEGLYMALMILIFFISFYILLTIQGNFHTSVGYLPLCGIISIGLSTGATFGLLTLFRIQIIEPMALLVFVVIIIDCVRISIVCGEYHRVINDHMITISDMSSEIDIEKILPSIIESTHPYFINSTCIISIVYLIISLISPMFATKFFCLTLVLYLFLNYLAHSTFFSSCLVITLKRISSRRHCLFCYRLSNDYYTKITKKISQLKSYKIQISSFLNNDSILKKVFSIIMCLLFFICLISSIWFTYLIDTRLFDDKFLPSEAYSLRKHMQSQINDFDIGPVIMFTIPESINYQDEQNRLAIDLLIDQCHNETRTNNFKLLWLKDQHPNDLLYGNGELDMRITPTARGDLILSEVLNSTIINASRFYCQFKSIQGDYQDIQEMKNLYIYSKENSIPSIFPYSLIFPTYESLKQIRFEIYLIIISLIIVCFIIMLIFYLSFTKSLIISLYYLTLLTSTLTCLYLFHNLTFNFANILWLYILPIIYLDIFIHLSDNKWIYNRVILSLILSLSIFALFPIQSYVFQIIHYSLLYQSVICLLLLNVTMPSFCYLFRSKEKKNEVTVGNVEGNQALTNGLEV